MNATNRAFYQPHPHQVMACACHSTAHAQYVPCVAPYNKAQYINSHYNSLSVLHFSAFIVMAIWDPTSKFNSCQYFQLYSIPLCQNDLNFSHHHDSKFLGDYAQN